jgi:RNA 2',3'-cyclic 3'-phosphodiesterase
MEPRRRWFIAIAVPSEVRERLAAVQAELRALLPSGTLRFVRADKMHLTLRFLGEVPCEVSPAQVAAALQSKLTGFGAIPLEAERLGCFPDLRYPRVVWAWVHDAGDRLSSLSAVVAEATAPFTRENVTPGFVGHVTLARSHRIKRKDAALLAGAVSAAVERDWGAWSAESVELVASEARKGGTEYVVLERVTLQ